MKKTTILLSIFLCVSLIVSLKSRGLATANPHPHTADLPRVSLEEIKLQSNQRKILLPVKIEPKIQSQVNADIEGNITRILKPLGAKVKAGEIVMYLENKDPGFTYAPVPVHAPVSGILSQVWTTQMSKVNRGDKLFTVINPDNLKLTGEFPSSELSYVRAGMIGKLKMESNNTTEYSIRLVGVSPLLDPRTGTASAEFEFMKNTSKDKSSSAVATQLRPPIGSIGQVQFEINQGEIILIPEAALIYRDGKPFVRVVEGSNKFTKKLIELGEQRDTNYIVKSGITKGEKIIVRTSRPLKEGESFEIEPSSSSKAQ